MWAAGVTEIVLAVATSELEVNFCTIEASADTSHEWAVPATTP